MITKKEVPTSRPVHRIDLSLPVVQTDSYEIFYTVPPSQNLRIISRQKPLIDIHKKSVNQTTRIRSPARLKHLTGPIFVNFVVDTVPLTAESISTMNDTASNRLINSSYSNRMVKNLPTTNKRNKQKFLLKDDGDQSQSSSGDRLTYESLGSFDDYSINKTKTNNLWQNMYHPQLTSTKALHIRKTTKNASVTNDMHIKAFDNLSQGSAASINEQLYERIEQLTKNYFPSIQQIRHTRPCPELTSNRMNLQREQKKNFMPILSRTRVVQ